MYLLLFLNCNTVLFVYDNFAKYFILFKHFLLTLSVLDGVGFFSMAIYNFLHFSRKGLWCLRLHSHFTLRIIFRFQDIVPGFNLSRNFGRTVDGFEIIATELVTVYYFR